MANKQDWQSALSKLAEAEGYDMEAAAKENEEKAANRKKEKRQKLTVRIENRGAAKKPATIIYGFNGTEEELEAFAAKLRKAIGTGGSARGGEILLQGDRREALKKADFGVDFKF